jgi:hypothetical protein
MEGVTDMAYVELVAGAFMLGLTAFIKTPAGWETLVFKAPLPILGAAVMADALSRLGLI